MTENALSHIRKESLDIYNRLHSIAEDIQFVHQVRETYPDLPILPNLRCGAWYTDPETATDIPAYFKSTDGHYGNWSFNLRRANLHLLPFLLDNRGLILVDSTRSGKRIPDALSKTVPIWCAVINRALSIRYPELVQEPRKQEWDTALYTPPAVVSSHEHHSIAGRLDGWAENLAASSFDLPKLPYPLRPMWITPAISTFPRIQAQPSFIPIICVSASKQVSEGAERRAGGSYTYVQGSGDDHELWGMGLTPDLFWMYKTQLLYADRGDLPGLVRGIASGTSSVSSSSSASKSPSASNCNQSAKQKARKRPTPITKIHNRIWIGLIEDVDIEGVFTGQGSRFGNSADEDENVGKAVKGMAYILIFDGSDPSHSINMSNTSDTLNVPESSKALTETSTKSSSPQSERNHNFLVFRTPLSASQIHKTYFKSTVLPSSLPFMERYIKKGWDICICCPTGRDLSVGVALVGLGVFFDENGEVLSVGEEETLGKMQKATGGGVEGRSDESGGRLPTGRIQLTKQMLKTRLEWIIASRPEANPARTTLKRVNEFLLSGGWQ